MVRRYSKAVTGIGRCNNVTVLGSNLRFLRSDFSGGQPIFVHCIAANCHRNCTLRYHVAAFLLPSKDFSSTAFSIDTECN